jgi:ABC-type nitrate/sulfonate/bicarbonate transport system permease component
MLTTHAAASCWRVVRGFTFAVIGATVFQTNGLDLRMTMMAVSMPMTVMLRVSAPLPIGHVWRSKPSFSVDSATHMHIIKG